MREIVKRETIGASIAACGGAVESSSCVSGAASQWQFAISHDPRGKGDALVRFTVPRVGASRQTGE